MATKKKTGEKLLGTGMAKKTAETLKGRKAQIDKAVEGKTKKPAGKDTGGKTTAKSPPGIQKTKAQGTKEKEALKKKIAEIAKKNKPLRKKK
jgi:hypothetical protein